MVASRFPATDAMVNLRSQETVRKGEAQQEMVDAETGVPTIGVPKIVEERIDCFVGMERAQGVGPSLRRQSKERLAYLRREQCILEPTLWFVDVALGWHDIEVARQNNRRGQIAS